MNSSYSFFKLLVYLLSFSFLWSCGSDNPSPTPPINDFPRNGLVAFYPFNGNANDESDNNSNGTVNGATLTSDRYGNANRAYSFDGIDDFIACGNGANLQITGNITICAWIKTNLSGNETARPIVAKYDNLAQEGYYLLVNFEDFVRWDLGFDTVNTNDKLPTNQWRFVAVTYDGSTLRTYIDGIQNNTKSVTGSIANVTSSLNIGTRQIGGTAFFNGEIDDVMIYNRALNANEITQAFNQNITE